MVDVCSPIDYSPEGGLLDSKEKRRPVKKELLRTSNFGVVLVCLDEGQEIPTRPEPYGVCFYVIEGKGVFTVGGEGMELTKGNMACYDRWEVPR